MNPVEARIAAAIRRRGPVPFSEVMEAALYDPEHGFYATTGAAGRRGDFLTSPEVGPLFGAVMARALDGWWRDAGEPDPFIVVEGGAGVGTLAVSVLAARPACLAALRYVLVERSDALRSHHSDHLALESAAHAFAPDRTENEEEARAVDVPTGPILVSLSELPRVGVHVVVANELLDNLPVDLVEGDHEVRVGLDGDRLVEVLVPATSSLGVAGRAPVQTAAATWVRDARALGARVIAFDYADTTPSLAARPFTEWMRTYRGHQRGRAVLDDLGLQDITCEVAIDQLPPPSANTSQADWLREHGLDELVAEGRAVWAQRAGIGDLDAIKARSRITEAEALTDPAGLGAFRVLEWY
ncbi:MAG TPA: SAM-dependent methyltransferase [Acidimicrobiales bacterium]|nr:SAM-dependent methyltransferase [Acidimicrobiales bacterium]